MEICSCKFIKDGAEDTGKGYQAGRYRDFIQTDDKSVAIRNVDIINGDYTFSGKDMTADGDIRHMDYQRIMTITLENATLKGAVASGAMVEWNALWATYKKEGCGWLVNDAWESWYGTQMTEKRSIRLPAGPTWGRLR